MSARGGVLVLNAAPAGAEADVLVALVGADGRVEASEEAHGLGAADGIAIMARSVLNAVPPPERIVVVTGPGSFTGLRASIALAHGLAFGLDVALLGISVGRACAAVDGSEAPWACLSLARRGRVFCERSEGAVTAFAPERVVDQKWPAGTVIHGDAQAIVSEELAAVRGWRLSGVRRPDAAAILRAADYWPSSDVAPLYIDPPEAKPPAAGLRPAPV